ncbi:uncharacterized protein LOC103091808 [Petromyzon marinus]|uniref:Proopiocortin n=2 Tax=Petromyzon marinus TaxID=7757 RepID=Q91258_PETMA|nr:proopiocortin [Petromyzon marinus]BAE16561.1 proopiocortin [Petromyzon marinus]
MMGNCSRLLLLLEMLSIISPSASAMCWARLDQGCFTDCKKYCSNGTRAGTPAAVLENLLACVQLKCSDDGDDNDDDAPLLQWIASRAESRSDFDIANNKWWLVRWGGQSGLSGEGGESGGSPRVEQVDLAGQVESSPASSSSQAKRSVSSPKYAMGHFRWGSPDKATIRKRRPVRPNTSDSPEIPDYAFNGVEGPADDAGDSVFMSRRETPDAAGHRGVDEAAATGEDAEVGNKDGVFRVPPPFKRYGGFMKVMQEIDHWPLVPVIRKVMHKESTKSL